MIDEKQLMNSRADDNCIHANFCQHPEIEETVLALWKVARAAEDAMKCLRNGLPCCMDGCEAKMDEALSALKDPK